MRTILFACTHNAGRSQMAAALFNKTSDPEKARAISAGTNPSDGVHPEVLEVMKEIGIDLSHTRPRRLTEELASASDLLVTMGCGETCPFVPDLETLDWELPDPKGRPIAEVRRIRDEVSRRVQMLLKERSWTRGL
jgi:arsenate reductase (thioredoxin)